MNAAQGASAAQPLDVAPLRAAGRNRGGRDIEAGLPRL